MDFDYLIKTGRYSEDDLNDSGKSFVAGLKEAKSLIESELASAEFDMKDESFKIIDRMETEIIIEELKELVELMDSKIAEAIVCLADEAAADNPDEQEESKENQETEFDPIKKFGRVVIQLPSDYERKAAEERGTPISELEKRVVLTGEYRYIFGERYLCVRDEATDAEYYAPEKYIREVE